MAKLVSRSSRKMYVKVTTKVTKARMRSGTARGVLARNSRWGKQKNLERAFRYG